MLWWLASVITVTVSRARLNETFYEFLLECLHKSTAFCFTIAAPFDTYDGATVCTVCREPVLACTRCREELDHVFYCEDHTQLKGIYFHYVDAFTSEDLAKQADQLRNLEKLPQSRHQRRTLRKQITRLENRQKEIKEGKIDPTDNLRTPPCRTCFARSCKGNCWGFHGKH